MSDKNCTLRIPQGYEEKVKRFLKKEGFEFRKIKNALWSCKKDRVCVNMYPSGIILLQGSDAFKWQEKILSEIEIPKRVLIGCDEAGKGEIFGPLVVCCAVIYPENFKSVIKTAPRDSKKVNSEKLKRIVTELKPLICLKYEILKPKDFNDLYGKYKNLNKLLDEIYRRLIVRIRSEFPSSSIVIDAYRKNNPFGKEVHLKEKADSKYIEVSVASLFAKHIYLQEIKKIEEDFNLIVTGRSPFELKTLARKLLKNSPKKAREIIKISYII